MTPLTPEEVKERRRKDRKDMLVIAGCILFFVGVAGYQIVSSLAKFAAYVKYLFS